MVEIIPILSVKHTGTHSVLECCRKAYPDFKVHRRNNIKRLNTELGIKVFGKYKKNIIFGHISLTNIGFTIDFIKKYPCITPMRDPLLALITWYHRHRLNTIDKKDIREIYIMFLLWSEIFFDKIAFHAPVDLNLPNLKYKNIDFSNLNTEGSSGNYDLKKYYYSGDINWIKNYSREFSIAYYLLTQLEFYLRPRLEQLGYSNLMWWNHKQTYDRDELLKLFLPKYIRDEYLN